jgi:pullulanase
VDVFVRGLNGDWSDAPSNLLPYQGGTLYEGNYELGAVSQTFKVASSDWSTVNCGSNGGPVVVGEPYALFCDASSTDLSMTVPATGSYRFSVDAADPANPVLTVTDSPPFPVDIFVRGFNADWSDAETNRLAFEGGGQYSVVLNLSDPADLGNRTFKVASSDWSAVNCGTGEPTARPGVPYALNCAADSGDVELATGQPGLYAFRVNATDPANPVVTVEKTPFDTTVFVRGLNQDWTESQPMRYAGGGNYEATATLQALEPGDRSFKVASSDWSTVNCGAGEPTLQPSVPYALNCAADSGDVNLETDQTGPYDFLLEASQPATPTLTVTGP